MNTIILENLELKIFTEQDALDYCQLNGINPEDITQLLLYDNELTDISGVKIFKNLKELYLNRNKIENISVLKNLNKLEYLNINRNKVTDISFLKDLTKLENLDLFNNKIKDISVLKNLTEIKDLSITNLELESDQIQYIQSLKKLERLYCKNGFKNIDILNKLNNNIIIK